MVVDLDARISWAFVMNKMSADIIDTRSLEIAQALYISL